MWFDAGDPKCIAEKKDLQCWSYLLDLPGVGPFRPGPLVAWWLTILTETFAPPAALTFLVR